jgi:hypothetical protein
MCGTILTLKWYTVPALYTVYNKVSRYDMEI